MQGRKVRKGYGYEIPVVDEKKMKKEEEAKLDG